MRDQKSHFKKIFLISNSKYLITEILDMNEDPLVSIIILNYNAGKLLIDCVRSVFSSTYSNFEVILVDNVSTDNSHKICKRILIKSN